MKKLHNNLTKHSKLYHRWHEHKYHQHHHWLVATCAFLISAYAIAGVWSLNINQADKLALSFEVYKAQAQSPCDLDDPTSDDTGNIQNAIDNCSVVKLKPDKIYKSGTLEMKSNVTLNLNGATIETFDDPSKYNKVSGSYHPVIIGFRSGSSNVKIIGTGDRMKNVIRRSTSFPLAPIDIPNSHNVEIRNIFIDSQGSGKNDGFHIMTRNNSSGITIEQVTIKGNTAQGNGGTDGIHIQSTKDVTIRDCDIDVWDDGLAISANDAGKPVDGYLVDGCKVTSKIRFGRGNDGGISNVTIKNVVVDQSARNGKHGINFMIGGSCCGLPPEVATGDIKNVHFENITLINTGQPIQHHGQTLGTWTGRSYNFVFKNITIKGGTGSTFYDIYGLTLDNITSANSTTFKFGDNCGVSINNLSSNISTSGLPAPECNGNGGCDCTTWQNQSCGAGICPQDEMQQTRSCNPADCLRESKCVTDNQCDSGDGGITTSPNLKVAFIGDTGYDPLNDSALDTNFEEVLGLIKQEGADMVIHSGDFDYADNPAGFVANIDRVLGTNFPYFVSIGNHDRSHWAGSTGYQRLFEERLAKINGADCTGDYGVKSSCTYQGLFFILSGAGTMGSGHASYITNQLNQSNHTWRICLWHKNQEAMQIGGKVDEVGWGPYEACRQGGAIIATAHSHTYARTKTLSNLETQTVDLSCQDDPSTPNPDVCVNKGSTFVFDSSLGGMSVRNQHRCTTKYPYGCNEWAKIYTINSPTSEGGRATFGALFITFNDGKADRATGYFKNIDGQVVDNFIITSYLGDGEPPPVCNNDGTCDPGEDENSCPSDCGSPPACDCNWELTDDKCGNSCLPFEEEAEFVYVCTLDSPASCAKPNKFECQPATQCQTQAGCDAFGQTTDSLNFEASNSTDPDNDQIKYIFNWGDNQTSQSSLVNSGQSAQQSHQYTSAGEYTARVKAQDEHGADSPSSDSLKVCISGPDQTQACNDDGTCDPGENENNCPADCSGGGNGGNCGKADLTCDYKVNIRDFGILLSFWGTTGSSFTPLANCADKNPNLTDLTQQTPNDLIDAADLALLFSQWGQVDSSCTGNGGGNGGGPPRATGDFPLIGWQTFSGAVDDFYSRFDLLLFTVSDENRISKLKALNPDIVLVFDIDHNTAFALPEPIPNEWILKDSQGNKITSYGSSRMMNMFNSSPVATTGNPEYIGKTYREYVPEYFEKTAKLTHFDGWGSQGAWGETDGPGKEWLYDINSNFKDVDADNSCIVNGGNVAWPDCEDHNEYSRSEWTTAWQEGVDEIFQGMRDIMGPDKLLIHNYGSQQSWGRSYINGLIKEKLRHYFDDTFDKDFYNTLAAQTVDPYVTVVNGYPFPGRGDLPANTKNDFRGMRFGLVTSMFNNNYYSFQSEEAGEHYWSYWYDEFESNLGKPTSNPLKIRDGLWVRFFDKGAAIAGTNGLAQRVTDANLTTFSQYNGPYYFFKGGQDPSFNKGGVFDSVDLDGYLSTEACRQGSQNAGAACRSDSDCIDGTCPRLKRVGDGVLLFKQPTTIVSDIIVDNADMGTSPASVAVQLSGGFTQHGARDGCRAPGSNYYTLKCSWNPGSYAFATASSGGNETAIYKPTIGLAGSYEVFEWHASLDAGNEATNVTHTINHANGSASRTVNQKQNSGQWNSLGIYRFNKGTAGNLAISTAGASGTVIADTIKFVYKGN